MIGLDNIICDGRSMQLLLREWSQLARSDAEQEVILPPLEVSFRDYVLAEEDFRDSGRMKRSLTYWLNRMTSLPEGPDLPLAMRPSDIGIPEFERFEARLGQTDWAELKRTCSEKGITPNALLMTAYGLCLANWSGTPDFTLNLTLFNRQPLHRDIDELVGDFTSLVLFAFQNVPTGSFAEAVGHVQGALWRDLDHMQVSAVRVIREFSRSRSLSSAPSYPVVFTSGLGVDAQAEEVSPLGQFGYGITQTPQVWIDHQVVERGGELIFNWDVVRGLFPDTMIASVFDTYCDLLHRLVHENDTWEQPLSDILPAQGFADFASEVIEPINEPVKTDLPDSEVRVVELEELLSDRIEQQLGYSGTIARDRTFFELGLNSITLMRIRQELQRDKGLDIQVIDIFAHPTVASLARRLASGTGGTPRPVRHEHENVPAADNADRRNRRRALKKRDASNAEILS
jgi:non-ribosomal peptide synthetase component F